MFSDALKRLGACAASTAWVGDRTALQGWMECTQGDWNLWLASRLAQSSPAGSPLRQAMIRAGVACAQNDLLLVQGNKRIELEEALMLAFSKWEQDPISEKAELSVFTETQAVISAVRSLAVFEDSKERADLARSHIPWNLIEDALNSLGE